MIGISKRQSHICADDDWQPYNHGWQWFSEGLCIR